MKILELFSGYGTASFALKQLKIDYELVGYSDIDKYANQCFKQNHCSEDINDKLRLGDCTNIDPSKLEDFDLLTGGFPCQAFSIAGKGLGELDTRGTLFNEIIRIAEVKQPRYMLLENVKGLTNKNHKETFNKILSELDRIGYIVNWKVLNTKEHGIPQNRERVFFVCFRRDSTIAFHNHMNFVWPQKQELKLFLRDILEDDVDEKYYLKNAQLEKLISRNSQVFKNKLVKFTNNGNKDTVKNLDTSFTLTGTGRNCGNNQVFKVGNVNPSGKGMNGNVYGGDVAPTITTNKGEGAKIIQLNNPKHSNNRIFDIGGISPCLNTMQGGNRQPFIAASRGRYNNQGKVEQKLEPKFDGASNSITTVQKDNYVCDPRILQRPRGFNKGGLKDECPSIGSSSWEQNNFLLKDFQIRKLTPRECFRLQGFLNDEINLEGLSNSQIYKLAGNGQSVNVVKKIFKNMFGNI